MDQASDPDDCRTTSVYSIRWLQSSFSVLQEEISGCKIQHLRRLQKHDSRNSKIVEGYISSARTVDFLHCSETLM